MSEAALEPSAGETAIRRYDALVRRRIILTAVLGLAAAALFVIDVATGASSLSIGDILRGIADPASLTRPQSVILWDVRLAQAAMAALVGVALSLAGAELQTGLNNPLASPFTLGISSAASFGAALAIVLGLGLPGVPQDWIVSANAFVFALGGVALLQVLSRLRGRSVESVVLFGTALMFSFNALLSLVQFLASAQALQQVVFWTMGSLSRSEWSRIAFVAAVVICVFPFSLAASWKMTALRLGEDRARSFGVDVARLRAASLLRVALLTATAVAFVGTIGFIGLVGPHIARLMIGEDHRFFLPASALTGATLMSGAAIAGKLIVAEAVLPIGVVTAVVGVPAYIALILFRTERA